MKNSGLLNRELAERLKKAETSLSDLEERYQHLVEGTHGLICTHDMDGVLLSINPAAAELLGYDISEIVGRNLRDFIVAARREYFHIFLERIKLNAVDKGVLMLEARDGRELTFQYHNIKITQNVDKPYVLGHAYDITEITKLQEKLKELTVTDDLTGLNNRRGFLARAHERMTIATRSGENLKLIFCDIDGLKKINDALGHAAGSQVICDAAEILKDSFRQSDVICRWGGDEYIVLLSQSVETSTKVEVDRIRQKIAAFNAISARPYTLSMSLGVVPIDLKSGLSLDAIIAQADESMYHHKRTKPR